MPDNLNGVMRSATENLHPNIGKLTAGGIERGVRKRRNRRLAQIAGAAASVTAVFGVVAAVGAPGHDGPATVSAGSSAVTTPPRSAPAVPGQTNPTGTPAPTPGGPTSPTPGAVSGDDMANWLQQALAPYHFTGEQVLFKAGTDDMGGPFATLRIGYDNQAGSTYVSIGRIPWQSPGGTLPQYISVQTLPDGSHVETYNGPEWPAGNGDPAAKRLDVTWYRTDGISVTMEVLNAVHEKEAVTATGLGLTPEQAAKVVESPVWDKAIASVLAKPVPSAPKVPNGDQSKLEKKKAAAGSPASSPASSAASTPGS